MVVEGTGYAVDCRQKPGDDVIGGHQGLAAFDKTFLDLRTGRLKLIGDRTEIGLAGRAF